MTKRDIDYLFEDHGSLWFVTPQTQEARDHLESNTDGQWFGLSLAVEPRYVYSLLSCLSSEENFTVEVETYVS
jgi:hypothetical protein